MPDGERTEFDTPIPLRESMFGPANAPQPNPYTRLEAVEAVERRLETLINVARSHAGERCGLESSDPDRQLANLLGDITQDLHMCVYGDLDAVTAVRTRSQATWYRFWAAAWWPSARPEE